MVTATSRELTTAALRFQHPAHPPRDLWTLPWSEEHQREALALVRRDFPEDICRAPDPFNTDRYRKGDPYVVGQSTDEWGCVFDNIQAGAVGEVKNPPLADDEACKAFTPPHKILDNMPADARDTVNRFCASTDRFVMSTGSARPWERYQFLRGSEVAMMDLADPSDLTRGVLQAVHGYYARELRFWATTDVDALFFLDDWGSQDRLLIHPELWREVFKPMYAEYAQIAHDAGKFLFMHSDGHILTILPDLIEAGIDAVNSQLFCMDLAEVAKAAKGRLTFWGEIDRQHVLPSTDPEDGRRAVRQVAEHLYDPSGGIIAQIAFELSVNPATAIAVYDEWTRVAGEHAPARP
jgi:uroporphyrinogen decarboxylase